MKNLLFTLALLVLTVPAFNQKPDSVLVNKAGVHILPEKGDLAIGIDAVPFLNLLNSKATNPGFNFVNGIHSFSFKYFNTAASAIRVDLLIEVESVKNGNDDFSSYSLQNTSNIGINVGYEKRLGKTRVQGFYGVEGGFIYGKTKNLNDMDVVSAEGSVLSLGARLFLGAEYFFAAKLSIGGQFTWGPEYSIAKNIHNKTKQSGIFFGADNANGALILAFHF